MNERRAMFLGAAQMSVGWLLFVMGGLSFWLGGRVLSEFWHVNRIVAELVGLTVAVLCVGVGALLKSR